MRGVVGLGRLPAVHGMVCRIDGVISARNEVIGVSHVPFSRLGLTNRLTSVMVSSVMTVSGASFNVGEVGVVRWSGSISAFATRSVRIAGEGSNGISLIVIRRRIGTNLLIGSMILKKDP